MSELNLPVLNRNQLQQAGRIIDPPFLVQVQQGGKTHNLEFLKVLRLLPGRRLVGEARWGTKRLLVKLFLDSTKATRHARREREGVLALGDAGCATADLLLEGNFADNSGAILGFTFLPEARTLLQLWQEVAEPEQVELMSQTMPIVARLHQAGLKQDDIHLDNFIQSEGKLYCIDGDGVDLKQRGQALDSDKRVANLAIYFAQLTPAFDRFIPGWLALYNTVFTGQALAAEVLQAEVVRWRMWRIDNYLKKSYRDCTEFVVEQNRQQFKAFPRELDSEGWRDFLDNLDHHLESGKRLKSGNTATVALAYFGDRPLVIKRYNIKNFAHRLNRCWRPSRAWVSWGNAHMLALLGILTPRPLALLEERCGPLRGRAFLVSEFCPGEDILARYHRDDLSSAQFQTELPLFADLFKTMARHQVSHGDFKANNLLLADNALQVIDLDAMRRHSKPAGFQKAFAKDLKRFMKNWQDRADISTQFAELLEREGLHY